jgi:two-component system nitrogen regulation response regulator GlnG
LFGVRRGAFTGAEADRSGYFGAADGGTLFLDEIGACDPGIQPQLLRALQQGEIQSPGGGTRRVDVRILAATDADLDDQFSKALRYRLGGVEMSLPPLRERREDIGRLLRHFLPAAMLENVGNDPAAVTRWVELVTRLALHDWPGNVRELANICQRLELAGHDPHREIADALHGAASSNPRPVAKRPAPSDEQVCDALLAARWEVAKAARELRISRQALYRRMEAIPELRTAADIPSAEITSAYYACEGDLERAALQLQVSRTALRRRWRALDLPAGGW